VNQEVAPLRGTTLSIAIVEIGTIIEVRPKARTINIVISEDN